MLLDGLSVALVGEARPLRFAGRCLADLGAEVGSAVGAGDGGDELDDLWLGVAPPLPAGRVTVDVALAPRGADLGEVEAGCVVRFGAAGAGSSRPDDPLDEREATAAAGIAVALGDPARAPLPLPPGAADALVGTHLAAAAIAALLDGSAETDVAAVDALAALVAINQNIVVPYGAPWRRAGRSASGHGGCYPYALFEASDGLFCMIGRTERDWRALLEAMGDPKWGREERFRDPREVARLHAGEADALVGAWTASHTRAELMEKLNAVGFACASVLRPDEVLELPALRGRWRTGRSADGIEVRTPGAPFDVAEVAADGDPSASAEGVSELRPPQRGLKLRHPLGGEDGEAPLVLDLSWVWSGPAVSVALADLGAIVVKVESSTRPDNSRLRGAPVGAEVDPKAPPLELSQYFQSLNRGKRSVELDLKTEEGRARLQALAARADVIVENLSPGVMERWGIAPAAVHATNPGCVFVSLRGYRPHPSTEGLRAYAPALSSAAGFEQMLAYPGEAPVGAMTIAFSDQIGAAQGLMLSLAGLWNRRRGGAGAAIEVSQHEVAILANGRNILADQLGRRADGLEPFAEDSGVVGLAELPTSPWVSEGLFGAVDSRWLGEVEVARLPWRRDGGFPELRGPAPELGADSAEFLGS